MMAVTSVGTSPGSGTTYCSSAMTLSPKVNINVRPVVATVPSGRVYHIRSGVWSALARSRGSHVVITRSPSLTCSTCAPFASTTPVDS